MSAILSRLEREADAYLIPLVMHLYARAQAPLHGQLEPAHDDMNMVIVDTIDDVRTVIQKPELFQKNLALIDFFGFSRFNTNGREWETRRSITQPSYTDIAKPINLDSIRWKYKKNIEKIRLQEPEYISDLLIESAVSVFNSAFVSDSEQNNILRIYPKIRKLLKVLQFLSWSKLPQEDQYDRIHSEVAYLLDLLDLESQRDPAFNDLYQKFRDPSGEIPNFRIASEYIMNAFAGSETSVTATLWAIDRLAALPDFQAELAAMDLDSPECGQRLDTFINETLRYFPPIPLLARQLTTQFDLGDLKLKQGQVILVSIIGLHHSTDHWKDPHIFDPDRSEFAEKSHDRHAFLPFFAGPRVCGGMRLARIEIREALKLFLQRFRISRTDDEISFDYGLVLRPKNHQKWKLDYR